MRQKNRNKLSRLIPESILSTRLPGVLALAILSVVPHYLAAQQPLPATMPGSLSLLDAAKSTLLKHPALQLQQQQVEINRGIKQQFAGLFDLTYNASYQQGYTNSPLTRASIATALAAGVNANNLGTNLSTFNVNASKLFRNGIQIGPVIDSTRAVDNLTNTTGINRTTSDFQISLPLLRNRGKNIVDAQEIAASLQIEASGYDLRQDITDLLAGLAQAYWTYVASRNSLEVARASEARGSIIFQNVKDLIAADREPRAEVNQAQANLADRIANRIAAEQQVVVAQQQLALAMGLSANEVLQVGVPVDGFPEGQGTAPLPDDPAGVERFIQEGLAQRADILANQKRVDAAQVQKVAAANQLLPQLNLTLSAGASGLDEGTFFVHYLNSPFHQVRGLDVIGGITFSFPPARNAARGQLLQATAAQRQAEIQVTNAARTIASNVVVAYHALRNAQAQLVQAQLSVDSFQKSLDNEREKLRLGIGSIVDILTVEDRLTSATLSTVQANLNYALALTSLRQATGTIVGARQTSMQVDRNTFYTIP